jgi:hypothetical protein
MLFVVAFAVVAAFSGIVFLAKALGRESMPQQLLLEYQLGKVGQGEVPDTAFFGDSSLGNAINADEWSRVSGKRAANFALTANYGYEGSYNMLRRVLAWGKPRHVIVMHIPSTPQTEPSSLGYWLTAPSFIAPIVTYMQMALDRYQMESSIRWLAAYGVPALRGQQLPPEALSDRHLVNDYIRQGDRGVKMDIDETPWPVSAIRDGIFTSLKRIGALCKEYALDCIYVHGPMVGPACQSNDYFKEIASQIESAGLRVPVRLPVCLDPSEAGDRPNHVRPDLKTTYTKKYYDIISPYVR